MSVGFWIPGSELEAWWTKQLFEPWSGSKRGEIESKVRDVLVEQGGLACHLNDLRPDANYDFYAVFYIPLCTTPKEKTDGIHISLRPPKGKAVSRKAGHEKSITGAEISSVEKKLLELGFFRPEYTLLQTDNRGRAKCTAITLT